MAASKTRKNAPRFEDIRFRASPRDHGSSIFLGFASAKLVIPNALGKDEDLVLFINSIQVKLLNGKSRIDLPQEKSADGRWFSVVAPGSKATRDALTELIFADPLVSATAHCVLEDAVRSA